MAIQHIIAYRTTTRARHNSYIDVKHLKWRLIGGEALKQNFHYTQNYTGLTSMRIFTRMFISVIPN